MTLKVINLSCLLKQSIVSVDMTIFCTERHRLVFIFPAGVICNKYDMLRTQK